MYPNRPLEAVAFVGQIEQVDNIRRKNRTRRDKIENYGHDKYGQYDKYRSQQFARSPAGCVGYVPQIWGEAQYNDYDKLGYEMGSKETGYKMGDIANMTNGARGERELAEAEIELGERTRNMHLLEKSLDTRMNKVETGKMGILTSFGLAMGPTGSILGSSRVEMSRYSESVDFQRSSLLDLGTDTGTDLGTPRGADLATDFATDVGTDLDTASASQYSTFVNPPSESLNLWKTESASTQSPGFSSFMAPSESSRTSPPMMLLSALNGSVESYGSNALQAFSSSPWGVSRLSIWMTPQSTSGKSAWGSTV